jgi:hypothetical protein
MVKEYEALGVTVWAFVGRRLVAGVIARRLYRLRA